MNTIITTQSIKTMTTREVADLIEKQHSNVKISAERLSAAGVIGTLATQEFTHNGNTYTEYLLCKRDSFILVAQNCPEFTARIVDRWQELERQAAAPAFVLPDFTNPAVAARAWADQVEKVQFLVVESANQQKIIDVVRPKADAFDLVSAGPDAVTITEAAKVLGKKRVDLTAYLHMKAKGIAKLALMIGTDGIESRKAA